MTMLDYIMEQPEIFRKVLEQDVEITTGFEEIFDGERSDRVYLIASRTSCNMAKAAAPPVEHVLKREVSVFPSSQIERVFEERPFFIFISQGGKSTNMIAAVEKMKGYPRIIMTGNADRRINSMYEHYIIIPCGDETVGPKTKGYTATILTLYLVVLEAAKKTNSVTEEEYQGYLAVLEASSVQYQENIERTRKWMEKNEEGPQALKKVYPAGKGQSMFVVQEGTLKVMETYLAPGLSYDFEGYLYGPSCSIRGTTGGMHLSPMAGGGDYERMQKLVAHHRSIYDQVYTAGFPASEDEGDCTPLNSGQWYTKPSEEMLPLQVICTMIPGKLGIDGAGMQHFKEISKFMDVKYKEDIRQAG